ncbi:MULTISPECIES: CopG family transcriptional regulator [Streptomyces]|uniref:CopG family transcriptional regulator n=1 Tax=Streptomyces cyaneofuscatus TaxID=66883 RepID=A0ABZ1EZP3_9ACTN|nr:CopG family transcriptional regulator [Streptomyces cyaneofuscatus]WSB09495.1 CopG family transcriptional regulator [Streptomyces cyaneofuscatus]
MRETTVALPEEPEGQPDAEPPKRSRELPVFDSGRPLTPHEMDGSVYEHIKERAARR